MNRISSTLIIPIYCSIKMPIPLDVVKCYKYIDLHSKSYVEELKEIVKIPNVSSDPDCKNHLSTAIKWTSTRLKQLGFNILLKEPDYQKYKVIAKKLVSNN